MRRFKSARQPQRFPLVQSVVQNLFRVSRHLLRSKHRRFLLHAGVRRLECGELCVLTLAAARKSGSNIPLFHKLTTLV